MSFALIFKRALLCSLTIFLVTLPKLVSAEESPQKHPQVEESASSGFTITADFLYFLASEEPFSIWADEVSVGFNSSSWTAKGFDFDWDYGVRVGAGYGFDYDHWDTYFSWTYFQTDKTYSLPYKPFSRIIPELFAAFLSGNVPRSMSINWDLLLHMFDWELGRDFQISNYLSLRPFIGVKGGWIDQLIKAKYYDLTINRVLTTETGKEHLKHNFWGVGPLGGIHTNWKIFQFSQQTLTLFGDFSVASLWGKWTRTDTYKNTASQKSTVSMKNSSLGSLFFRGFMGLGWSAKLNDNRAAFSTNLGYEMQIFLNQLRFATFQLQCLHGDLTLHGLTLNCQLDF